MESQISAKGQNDFLLCFCTKHSLGKHGKKLPWYFLQFCNNFFNLGLKNLQVFQIWFWPIASKAIEGWNLELVIEN